MKILAIDTATEACSAALYVDGKVRSHYQLAPREHSLLILKMVEQLLVDANAKVKQLDAITFGRGPGSFMGLRIAAGVVQGIAYAHDIPVIPLSTLQVIAQRAYQQTGCTNILAAIDARMDEVYWAAYSLDKNSQRWHLDGDECVISPDKIVLPDRLTLKDEAWVAAGTGWQSYSDRLLSGDNFTPREILLECYPSAEIMVELAAIELAAGNTVPAEYAIPVYLRNDVAKKPKPVVF